MNDLQIFNNNQFGEVRTLEQDGKVLFCGSDVAKALGYDQPHKAIDRHCKNGMVQNVPHPQSPNKTIEMKFIPEGDLYRLITHSKLEQAEKFESWVFDEVLPSIRKHGMYAKDDLLDNPDLLIDVAQKLKAEREEKLLLQSYNVILQQKVAEYEPKIEYMDKILASKGTLTVTQIGADYGLSARRLNDILHEEHIQYCVGGQWILYKEHMESGYTKSETIQITHKDGTPDTKMNTKWTQKGRLLIHNILASRGIKANMDRSGVA